MNEISEKEESEVAEVILQEESVGTKNAEPRGPTVKRSAERVVVESDKPKKEERQHGDLGLYRFYFSSIAAWQGAIWVLLVALAVIWNQMPGKWASMKEARPSYGMTDMPFAQQSSFGFGLKMIPTTSDYLLLTLQLGLRHQCRMLRC